MKVTELETYLVSVPYKHVEVSTRVQRGGVTAVIVKSAAITAWWGGVKPALSNGQQWTLTPNQQYLHIVSLGPAFLGFLARICG